MTSVDWAARQLEASRNMIQQGRQALQQNNIDLAQAALTEAAIVLDMAPTVSGDVQGLRAQAFNELGVIHQRRGDAQGAFNFHSQSALLCKQLVDAGRADFQGNNAATHLNFASICLAVGELDRGKVALEIARDSVEALLAQDSEGALGMAVAIFQTSATLDAQQDRFDTIDAYLERSVTLARKAIAAGQQGVYAQAAQGLQQASVILFHKGQHEAAFTWGKQAETFSEEAFEAIGEEVLPIYIVSQINLLSYNEQLGRFAEAEDSFWKAIELVGNDPRLLKRGKDFYEHCRKQSDKRLEAGNLPRAEVNDSYAEVLERIEEIGGLPPELLNEGESGESLPQTQSLPDAPEA